MTIRSGKLWSNALLQELDLLMLGGGDRITRAGLGNLRQRILDLETALLPDPGAPVPVAAIDNYLRNSDFDHSALSYTGAGAADEAAWWKRDCVSAQPVKDAATVPLWKKADGWIELSSSTLSDDLSYNFSTRLIRPGIIYWFQCLAKLATDVLAPGAQLEVGFWDKTVGIDNWLRASLVGSSGSNAPLVTKIGAGAATTNYGYRVTASDGAQNLLVSAEGTITGVGTLTSADYHRIEWAAVNGTVQYRVYRTTGPVTGLIAVLDSGSTSWLDQGVTLEANAPLPPAVIPEAKYVKTDFGQSLTREWSLVRAGIPVPSGYNLNATTATGQWLRLGVRGLPAGAVIAVDRLGISLAQGVWAPSPEDRQTVGDIVITPVGDGGQPGIGDLGLGRINYGYEIISV